MESLICKGKVQHGAHDVLRWQIGCVQLQRVDADNIKISKRKNQEGQKVDGWVAAIMALGCYLNNSEPDPMLEVISL
jgi:phage terminase large subunit-like protein